MHRMSSWQLVVVQWIQCMRDLPGGCCCRIEWPVDMQQLFNRIL